MFLAPPTRPLDSLLGCVQIRQERLLVNFFKNLKVFEKQLLYFSRNLMSGTQKSFKKRIILADLSKAQKGLCNHELSVVQEVKWKLNR